MPVFNYACTGDCAHVWEAFTHHRDVLPACPICGGAAEKIHTGTVTVIPDTIPGGMMIENIASTPMRFDSKSEFKLELAKRGMQSSGMQGLGSSQFRHMGDPGEGSDKGKKIYDPVKGRFVVRSTRWASGPPPGVDMRPSCMLSPDEQAARHAEWLASEPAGQCQHAYIHDPASGQDVCHACGHRFGLTTDELLALPAIAR